MDQKYNSIYNALYADYAYDFGFPRRRNDWFIERESEWAMVMETRRAIELAEMEALKAAKLENIRLRPDAKLFLLANFHLMVIKPVMEADNRQWDQTRVEKRTGLITAIKSDILSILTSAYAEANENQEREVSGHSVLSAINKRWKDMETMSFNIWGGDE
ncbi:MAG: hypothetical protein ACOH13_10290 [Flavobacteriales bacterium]